jgi:hypothetical protein
MSTRCAVGRASLLTARTLAFSIEARNFSVGSGGARVIIFGVEIVAWHCRLSDSTVPADLIPRGRRETAPARGFIRAMAVQDVNPGDVQMPADHTPSRRCTVLLTVLD